MKIIFYGPDRASIAAPAREQEQNLLKSCTTKMIEGDAAMKSIKLSRLAPLAVALALCGPGMAANAYADAYAVSYDNIFNLLVTNTGTVTVTSSTPYSKTATELNGVNVASGGNNVTDALPTSLGSETRVNNVFNFFGTPDANGSYSNADAWIPTEQFSCSGGTCSLTKNATQSINVAENDLASAGAASSTGQNGSNTGFDVTFLVTANNVTISIGGNAVPYMQALLSPDLALGSSAQGVLTAGVSLSDNTTGSTVWTYNPSALNHQVSATTPGASVVYDPTGCGSTGGTSTNCANALSFSATSPLLTVGDTYTLAFAALETATTLRTVPEPGTLALLGLGLAGLGFGIRRRRIST